MEQELYRSSADKAYEIIYEEIVAGKLAPGTKLSRRKMAELTEMSVIPVIEALKRLESDGLVESKPRWGSFVTVPTKEKLDNQYILRETIECKVVELLTQRGLNESEELYLRTVARQLDSRIPPPNRAEVHHDFHYKLAEFTGYSSFTDTLKRIDIFFILCRALATRRRNSPVPPDWHERIVNVIQSGDVAKAQRVMKDHINDSYYPILQEINRLAEQTKPK